MNKDNKKKKDALLTCPLVGLMIAALERAVVVSGLSAAGAGISSIGIPKDSVP